MFYLHFTMFPDQRLEKYVVLYFHLPIFPCRLFAYILLIVFSGRQHVCKKHEEEKVYLILEKKLWDDPTRVRNSWSAKNIYRAHNVVHV